jgi:hypothetical protein
MGREEMFAGRWRPVDDEPTTEAIQPGEPFDRPPKRARTDTELSHRAFRVLACLEGYCFGEDRESWACNRSIGAASGGIGVNAVRLALRELERLGYILIIPDITRMRGSRIRLLYMLKQAERYD